MVGAAGLILTPGDVHGDENAAHFRALRWRPRSWPAPQRRAAMGKETYTCQPPQPEECASPSRAARAGRVRAALCLAVAQASTSLKVSWPGCWNNTASPFSYAIHPGGGPDAGPLEPCCWPRPMWPYDQLIEWMLINPDFPRTERALIVLGATTWSTPAAQERFRPAPCTACPCWRFARPLGVRGQSGSLGWAYWPASATTC